MTVSIRFKNLGQESGTSEMHFDSFPTWAKWCLDITNDVSDPERGLLYASSKGGYHAKECMGSGYNRDVTGAQVIKRIEERDVKEKMRNLVTDRLNGLKVDIQTQFEEVEAPALFIDESGLMLDSTAYFSGEESCMFNYDMTHTTKPVVWIAETLAMNSGFDDRRCANKCAALIAVIRACELQGISVGIVGYSSTSTMNGYTVTLKQPSDYLDEAMLLNLFADRDCMQTLDFCTDGYIKNYRVNGGVTTMTDECLYRGFSGAHNIVKIPCQDQGNYNSVEDAIKFYKDSIQSDTGVKVK